MANVVLLLPNTGDLIETLEPGIPPYLKNKHWRMCVFILNMKYTKTQEFQIMKDVQDN